MSNINFSDWNLPEYILDAIAGEAWEKPTEIQRDAIPSAREGRDIIGQARTGSGKVSHPIDISGKTIQHYHVFELETGDNSQVVCLNYSTELENQGHTDELNLTLGTGEYGDFVSNRAYK
mgnify:CR=1 FL=1